MPVRSQCLLFWFACLPLALACRDNSVAGPAAPADSSDLRLPLRVDLGTLGGASSFANDINGVGTVVGSADNGAGLRRAFRWTAGRGMVDLGTLPGDDWSEACCIADDGRVLGMSGSSSVSLTEGKPVIWSTDGTITALPIPLLPGARFGAPSGFNAGGQVVGWDVFGAQHAWIWSEARGKFDITAAVPGGSSEGAASDVDRNGLVLGTNHSRTAPCAQMISCWRPFLWSESAGYRELAAPDADPAAVATALGLNDGPTIVGWARTSALGQRPYVWREGSGFTILPTTAGGYALAINSRGVAVGAAWDPALGAYQATAWRRSGDAIRLSPSDPNPQVALAVNDMGVAVGWSARPDGSNHATLWIIGPASQMLLAVRDAPQPASSSSMSAMAGAGAATNACLANPDALVSRGALISCVGRASRGLPPGSPSR